MRTDLNFRQLIDLAIGSPEPGHVNFYALHILLSSFAEKLNIIDEPVDNEKYETVMGSGKFGSELYDATSLAKTSFHKHAKNTKHSSRRQSGGADPDEQVTVEESDIEELVREVQLNVADTIEPEVEEDVPIEQAPIVEDQPPVETIDQQPSEKALDLESIPPVSEYKEEEAVEQALEQKPPSGGELEVANQVVQLQIPEAIYRGTSIMKDQLELAMEQVRILVMIAINKKTTNEQLDKLSSLLPKMLAIRKENIYIENAFGFRISDAFPDTESDRAEDGEDEGEEGEEGEEGKEGEEGQEGEEGKEGEEGEEETDLPSDPSIKPVLTWHYTVKPPTPTPPQHEEYDLDMHLCYSPDKLLDQLMDLKAEFCLLTTKVNEISATILDHDCQRTTMHVADQQDQMKDMEFYVSSLQNAADRIETKNASISNTLEELTKSLEDMMNEKIDKSEIEIILADKVDYNQLQRKVSQDQMQELQCRLEKRFTEVHKQIKLNDNMRTSLGLASVDDILNRFKEKIEAKIQVIQETLQKYMDATNDECAAAGSRKKVLKDLACISCDTTCVMRTMEKSKVAKLPNAHASNLLSPLITYEIGSIRKSGVMGSYRKDEFPHAWVNQQKVLMKMCVPRHAGGAHTTHTAREHFEKVVANKK